MSSFAVDATNPYAPPQSATVGPATAFALVGEEPALSLKPRVFEVGLRERHAVEVRINVWSGEETYLVDGELIRRTRSWWGRRRFSVGEKETHEVEVRVAASGRVSVYVDRQLAHPNLFPALPLVPLAMIAAILGAVLLAVGAAVLQVAGASVFLQLV
jgi:hypothetical protein